MKKVLIAVMTAVVLLCGCTNKKQESKKETKVTKEKSVEVNDDGASFSFSFREESITVTGDNNTVSSEDSYDNTNN